MTTTHVEYPEDYTERVAPVRTGYTDPHEQTGSDAETMTLGERIEAALAAARRRSRLAHRTDNTHKWRLYYRAETGTWHAYQPEQMTQPMFPGQDRWAKAFGGQYGIHHTSGTEALALLQVAILKAEAAA